MTTEDESDAKVDVIRGKVATAIMHEPLFETVVALMLLAGHTAVHDGATEEDFMTLAKASYRRSIDVHTKSCKGDA